MLVSPRSGAPKARLAGKEETRQAAQALLASANVQGARGVGSLLGRVLLCMHYIQSGTPCMLTHGSGLSTGALGVGTQRLSRHSGQGNAKARERTKHVALAGQRSNVRAVHLKSQTALSVRRARSRLTSASGHTLGLGALRVVQHEDRATGRFGNHLSR